MRHHSFRNALGLTLLGLMTAAICAASPAPKRQASPLPLVETSAAQPLIEQVKSLQWLLENRGMPLSAKTRAALEKAYQEKDEAQAVKEIQEALDPYCRWPSISIPKRACRSRPARPGRNWCNRTGGCFSSKSTTRRT